MLFLNILVFGFETYRRFSDVDLRVWSCTSLENLKILAKYGGVKLCMILYISIAFWYITLLGNSIHFNSAKSSGDGVSNGLSKMDLAARF